MRHVGVDSFASCHHNTGSKKLSPPIRLLQAAGLSSGVAAVVVTRTEAASLLQVLNEKPCVHSYRRPDGTVLFAEDVPVCAPVAAITKRLMPRSPAKTRGHALRVMALLWLGTMVGLVCFSMTFADKIQSFFSDANSSMDGGPGFP